MARTILVIDDEENMRWVLKRALEKSGYEVLTANRGEQGLKLFARHPVDLVLLDLKMPGMDGLGILRELRQRSVQVPILLLTAYASVPTAVEALKLGAIDYLRKPFDLEDVLTRISHCLYRQEGEHMEQGVNAECPGFQSFIGTSPTLNRPLTLAATAAETDYTVLIQGEAGSGRQHLAHLIHQNYPTTGNGTLVTIDCANLPVSLLQQELLDKSPEQKSADVEAIGRWQQALGGTLLLANANVLPETMIHPLVHHLSTYLRMPQQPYGLRLLLTSEHDMPAAWESLLETAIRIELPPLRQRLDDLHFLLTHFTPNVEWSQEAQHKLASYDWLGNVGELKHIAQQTALLAHCGKIEVTHLPPHILGCQSRAGGLRAESIVLPPEGIDLDGLEKDLIGQALEMSGGNKAQAARLLGLTRATLLYRIDKHELAEPN